MTAGIIQGYALCALYIGYLFLQTWDFILTRFTIPDANSWFRKRSEWLEFYYMNMTMETDKESGDKYYQNNIIPAIRGMLLFEFLFEVVFHGNITTLFRLGCLFLVANVMHQLLKFYAYSQSTKNVTKIDKETESALLINDFVKSLQNHSTGEPTPFRRQQNPFEEYKLDPEILNILRQKFPQREGFTNVDSPLHELRTMEDLPS